MKRIAIFASGSGTNFEALVNEKYRNGEIVLLNKIDLKVSGLERFDIVVFDYNKDLLIKRVIGLPGETVEYINNELYINYKKIDIPFELEFLIIFIMLLKNSSTSISPVLLQPLSKSSSSKSLGLR